MQQILFAIYSQDDTFLDFYGNLAHNLDGHGIVYVPHAVVPTNARIAIPAPEQILVGLDHAEAMEIVKDTISNYLTRFDQGKLDVEGQSGHLLCVTQNGFEAIMQANRLYDLLVPAESTEAAPEEESEDKMILLD